MLTSQGDKEQIFVHDAGTSAQSLSVLGAVGVGGRYGVGLRRDGRDLYHGQLR